MAKKSDYAFRDLSETDLRGADFTDCVLLGTDLRGSKLHGAKISLDCSTFDGVKLDERQVAMLLLLLAQASIEPWIRDALHYCASRVNGGQTPSLQAMLRLTE